MSTAAANPLALGSAPQAKPIAHWHDRLAQGLLLGVCAFLVVFLLAPLFMLLIKSVEDKSGAFVGLQLFKEYFQTTGIKMIPSRTFKLHYLKILPSLTPLTWNSFVKYNICEIIHI